MTYLILNRLVIYKGGEAVYDEPFHKGVNIIRGENGSGKSTISNFIYYVLGGDFAEWLPEAKKCDTVYAEVNINDKTISIRRRVSLKLMQPMDIFLGTLDKALANSSKGWLTYSYRTSENKESFSQYLFKLLDFPFVTTEENDSVTANQVLRLLYIDQLSLPDNLIKSIPFDSPLIREAIGNLLLGVYNDELFSQQIELKEKKRELSDFNREFKAIQDVYKVNKINLDINKTNKEIQKRTEEIEHINDILKTRNSIKEAVEKNQIFKNIQQAEKEINSISKQVSNAIKNRSNIESEIIDSSLFIDELKKQENALHESYNTREAIGELDISFCPSCLSKLESPEDDKHCKLCKKTISTSDHKSRILRVQHEIQTQIKESEQILETKELEVEDIAIEIKSLKTKLNNEQKKLDDYIITSEGSSIERKYDELLIKKGELLNEIEYLNETKKSIAHYNNLKAKIKTLKSNIDELIEAIETKIEIQKKNLKNAQNEIQKFAIEIIKKDGIYESEFINAYSTEVNFKKNLFSLNGRNHFSASSLVVLKNAIRFAIFFASLKLESMRYPRFILCDNIEDKGMVEKRSQNFQNTIVDIANNIDADYQIIFTTSMISPKLNIDKYTVGDFYSSDNKSLKGIIIEPNSYKKDDSDDEEEEGGINDITFDDDFDII